MKLDVHRLGQSNCSHCRHLHSQCPQTDWGRAETGRTAQSVPKCQKMSQKKEKETKNVHPHLSTGRFVNKTRHHATELDKSRGSVICTSPAVTIVSALPTIWRECGVIFSQPSRVCERAASSRSGHCQRLSPQNTLLPSALPWLSRTTSP